LNKKHAMNNSKTLILYIPVTVAMVLFGFSYIWYKQAYQYYGPVTVITLRLVLAVPLLFFISLLTRKLQRIQKMHFTRFIFLGIFEPFLYFLGESYGVSMISSTLAALIISLIPLFVTIPAKLIFREKFSRANYTGLLISIVGVALVIGGESSQTIRPVTGILLMLLAVTSAVFHSVFVRSLTDHYNTFTIVTYQTLFGLICFLPLFLFTEYKEFIHGSISLFSMMPVIKMSVFASVIAFLLFVYSIKQLGIAGSNTFVNLIPVVTAILSFLLIGEQFSTGKIAGILTVITGLFISQYHRKVT